MRLGRRGRGWCQAGGLISASSKRNSGKDDESEEAGLIGFARGGGAPPVIGDQCWGQV